MNDRWSLRDLADFFNRWVLEEVLAEMGLQPVDGEVENTHHLLVFDRVSTTDRTRVERQFERKGIDVEELRSDFITRQATGTFPTQH